MSKDTEFIKILYYFYGIMNDSLKYCIGVMSGTSLDGVDLCYVQFDSSNHYRFDILKASTIAYSETWINKLKKAFTSDNEAIQLLDNEFGDYLGELINIFIVNNAIDQIDFVASHGHTIFHKPEKGITLQIGNGQIISNRTGLNVVCDFRTQDVQNGGQGAPLVPIGDHLLFSKYDYCINLGGFANISFEEDQQRVAFDVCPVNIVMNHFMNQLGLSYDDRGQLASKGELHDELLSHLNNLEFYNLPYPKSLGWEWVLENVFPLIDNYNLATEDILRTYVEHIAFQLAKIITPDGNQKEAKILVTGGGTFNTFLIRRIEFFIHQKIVLPNNELIDYKEALIFAFLGLLKLQGENNVLSSVTGANKDHSSGLIFKPLVY